MVAIHSHAWLHAIAGCFASKLKFDKPQRKRLFNKITDLSPVCEAITADSRKRRMINYIDDIFPQELVIELLSRLPVKDVVKYRCVSKKWRSLIDHPGFVSTHLNNYKNNSEGSQLLVIERRHRHFKKVILRRSDTFRMVIELNNCSNDGQRFTRGISGYVNGVMLIRTSGRAIILWNPSINTSLTLSDSSFLFDLSNVKLSELGLGFDTFHNDLKVVAIVYPRTDDENSCYGYGYPGTAPGYVKVYRLSTKSWSNNLDVQPPPYWSDGPQLFFNGCIHWTNLGPQILDNSSIFFYHLSDSHIVSFDVTSEAFNYFELPGDVVEDREKIIIDKCLIVLKGLLGMFYHYRSHCEVWVMEEYGVPSSWNKRYNFDLPSHRLLHFKGNGVLLFCLYGKGIHSYDAERKSLKRLAKTYSNSICYSGYTYVESLLLG